MSDIDWEVPYIPPEGIVAECLLPDGCDSCDDPIMQRGLEPLARFDRPQLKRAPAPGRDPLWSLGRFISKECAGLVHRYRPGPAELRQAFADGRFPAQHRIALEWAFAGMRRKFVFPILVAGARLPIHEVARCFWIAFDGMDFGCGPWLNQWADDPDRPHPGSKVEPPLPVPPESAVRRSEAMWRAARAKRAVRLREGSAGGTAARRAGEPFTGVRRQAGRRTMGRRLKPGS